MMQDLDAASAIKDERTAPAPALRPGQRADRFYLLRILLLLAAVVAPLWHLHVIDTHMLADTGLTPHFSDLIPRLIAAKAALAGRDPYSPGVLREVQTVWYGRPLTTADEVERLGFWYPAHVVILLDGLTNCSWASAQLLFFLVVGPLLAAGFWLLVRLLALPLTGARTAAVVFLSFCSWPVVWALRLQQLTLLVAALVFIACHLIRKGHMAAAGVLLGIATIKPQLVLLLVLWLVLWSWIHRTWSFIASFGVTIAMLFLWSERLVPGWLPRWIAAVRAFRQATATMLPLQMMFGDWVGSILTLLLVGWSGFLLWRLRRSSPSSREFGWAISLVLATTVCTIFTAPGLIYNQILLVPACLLVMYTKPVGYYAGLLRRLMLGFLSWGFISVLVAVVGETALKPGAFWGILPFENSWLPIILTACCSWLLHETTFHGIRLAHD